jgi:hypothetical protein
MLQSQIHYFHKHVFFLKKKNPRIDMFKTHKKQIKEPYLFDNMSCIKSHKIKGAAPLLLHTV